MNSHNPMNIAADFAKATGGTARKVVALTDKGPLNGFKKFLSRGSMIDMAVGVVMGSAVTAVVNSIVDNLISPLIGTTCITFFEREKCSGASPGVSAKPIPPAWLVPWKTGSAWPPNGR